MNCLMREPQFRSGVSKTASFRESHRQRRESILVQMTTWIPFIIFFTIIQSQRWGEGARISEHAVDVSFKANQTV